MSTTTTPDAPPEIRGTVALAKIRPSPLNPRKHFPDESIRELADSFREHGILSPLLVRPVPLAARFEGGRWEGLEAFELVDGERRFRAADLNRVDQVPVAIRWLTDEQVLAVTLITRDQSADLLPSERATGYAALVARGRTLEQIAAETGKPLGFVRSVLRLARLPAWALAAVDRGDLPRASADLVARVPSESGRKTAAACALLGYEEPRLLSTDDRERLEKGYSLDATWFAGNSPLSYRQTDHLLRTHFTRQLKGVPFGRKELYTLPDRDFAPPACDDCPSLAGNDPEAKAAGTRADVCLNPECFDLKTEAYRRREIEKAAEKHVEHLDTDERFAPGHAPKGFCDLATEVWQTELHPEFPIGTSHGAKHRDKKLKDLLGKLCPQKFLAFAADGRPRTLVRTADARRALQDAGVLAKPPKEKPKARVTRAELAGGPATVVAHPDHPIHDDLPKPRKPGGGAATSPGPSPSEVLGRATLEAAKVLGEYGEEQFSELADVEDACQNGPVVQALRLVARAVGYDAIMVHERRPVVALGVPGIDLDGSPHNRTRDAKRLDEVIGDMPAPRCLAFLLQLAAAAEIATDGPNTDTARELLDFAEIDWDGLQGQARRELAGGESADEKLTRAEAEQQEPAGPDRNTLEGGLWAALHCMSGSAERWAKHRAAGLDDKGLKEAIGYEFGTEGGAYGPGLKPVGYKGGKNPQFWFDAERAGKPTLAGRELVSKAREVLKVPHPFEVAPAKTKAKTGGKAGAA